MVLSLTSFCRETRQRAPGALVPLAADQVHKTVKFLFSLAPVRGTCEKFPSYFRGDEARPGFGGGKRRL
jgi:hypothetical protein